MIPTSILAFLFVALNFAMDAPIESTTDVSFSDSSCMPADKPHFPTSVLQLSPSDLAYCSGQDSQYRFYFFNNKDTNFIELCLEAAVNSKNTEKANTFIYDIVSLGGLDSPYTYFARFCEKKNLEAAQIVYENMLLWSSLRGVMENIILSDSVPALEFLLIKPLDPHDIREITKELISHKKWDMLELLISAPKVNLKLIIDRNVLFHRDCEEVWHALVQNKNIDPLSDDYRLVKNAIEAGRQDIIAELIKLPQFDPSYKQNGNILMSEALDKGFEQIAILLLKDPRSNIDRQTFALAKRALQLGAHEFVRAMFEKGIADDHVLNMIVKELIEKDCGDLLSLALKNPSIDPTHHKSRILTFTCELGSTDCFRVLLQDGRANPMTKTGGRWLIAYAASLGHYEILKMLLKDPRVDPTSNNNEAIMLANTNQHRKCTTLLLEDSRVFESIKLNHVNFLCSGLTGSSEKQLLWKWLLKNENCNGILTAFDKNREFNMSMDDFDTVKVKLDGLGAFSIVKLVQRKIHARRLIHTLLDAKMLGRAGEGLDLYDAVEEGFLEDKEEESVPEENSEDSSDH